MITASKSGRKIGSYYISRLNGLFNKTLMACIISHSSLLKFIKIPEVLFRVMPSFVESSYFPDIENRNNCSFGGNVK